MRRTLRHRIPLAAAVIACAASAPSAQVAAPDSLFVGASPDSSVARAAVDSLAVARNYPDPPALAFADFGAKDFADELPEGLDAALRRMPAVQLRVQGERGAPSRLGLSPIGESAPEILLDGVPMRSPADLDPAIYDIGSGDLAGIRVGDGHHGGTGDLDLRLERTQPVPGRTLTRAQFSSTRRESYYRSLALSTPYAAHGLRMNFEEWKSELGVDYADLATASIPGFGYAKQRHFQLEMHSRTRFGRALAGFGRGRRSSPGSLLGTTRRTDATERWTGQVYAGLDQYGGSWSRSVRLYQVDAREVDESGGQQLPLPQSSGQRLGVRVEQLAAESGWDALLQVERWSALWHPQSSPQQRARGRWIARAGLAREQPLASDWSLRAGVRAEGAEQVDDPDFGASLRLGWRPRGPFTVDAGALRHLRIPSLLETDGRRELDFVDGRRRALVGSGGLRIERHDRAHLGLRLVSERWRGGLRLERWELTRGVGQRLVGDELHFVGDARMRVDQARGDVDLQGRLERSRWSVGIAGHRVLGDLQTSRGRGSGWPTYAAQTRARIERPFFSQRNALVGEFFWKWSGPRVDDGMAAIGAVRLPGQAALSTTIPSQRWLELRAALRIRDAELYVAWDNPDDQDHSESFGTLRRPRQLRWGLFWTIYN